MRPLTIAQLLKATQAHSEAEWTVDDVEIGQVRADETPVTSLSFVLLGHHRRTGYQHSSSDNELRVLD